MRTLLAFVALSLLVTASPLISVDATAAPTGNKLEITKVGALGDDKTLNTTAIQAAIEQLAKDGGGTVVIPPGVFVSGALFFKPGVNLHLDKGAVLKCSTDRANFPPQRTRIEGHFEEKFNPALINANGCDGFQLTGEGILDGNGGPIWDEFWAKRNTDPGKENIKNILVQRARLCLIENSKGVKVTGITFKDSQFWNLHLYNCQDSVVENCRFEIPDKGSGPSTDGVDIDSCQNIVVRGCHFSVNDDCVCLKGNRYDGLTQEPKSPPVRNVLVENCTFVRGHGALTLGTEAQSISDVEMKDCVVKGNMPMLRLKLRPDTANQDYRKVWVHDIRLEGREGYIVVVSPKHGTKVPPLKAPISKISDIVIENISGKFGSFGTLSGGGTGTVSNVTMRNIDVTLTGRTELNTEGVADVKMENVSVKKAQ